MIDKEYKKILIANASRHIESILDKLGVPYTQRGELIQSKCPAKHHAGDGNNMTAFSWRSDCEKWICWTHGCHEVYGSDILGLVRSITLFSFEECVKLIHNMLNEHGGITNLDCNKKNKTNSLHIHRPLSENILAFLKPENSSPYLLKRGFKREVLEKYQVGEWHRLGTHMHNRVVIPVRDHDKKLIGFTGRAIGETYEDKWIHGRYFNRFSGEFRNSSVLFNLYNVTGNSVILCEGPLDGFAFEMAGIKNWICTLGKNFQPQHRSLLIQRGICEILICYDTDKAGISGTENVKRIVGDFMTTKVMTGISGDPGSYVNKLDELLEIYHANTENNIAVSN